jgi:hypothetical protein
LPAQLHASKLLQIAAINEVQIKSRYPDIHYIKSLDTMARYAMICLAAALLCTAVLAQEVTPAHRGGTWDAYSSYDTASQRYRPVSEALQTKRRQPGIIRGIDDLPAVGRCK